MPEITGYQPGQFCWVELSTTDVQGAKSFYSELLGVDAEDSEIPGGGTYVTLSLGGKSVCGITEQPPQQRDAGVPPNWASYVSVDDLEARTKIAGELGGHVHAEPFDVMDLGRMSVIQDAVGAHFCLWEPKKSIGAEIGGEPGTWSWNELLTPQVDRAATFYTELFGWASDEMEMATGGTYTVFKVGDRPTAGMMPPPMSEIPPHWFVYFNVADCDASVSKAAELGGSSAREPFDAPGVGRIGILSDPQGGSFGIIQAEQG